MGSVSSDLARTLQYLTPEEREEFDRLIRHATPWRPFPGPQTEAYRSPADILLYGGAAGGG